jgi:flavodoxin
MKALVVYESLFGNTEKVAQAIADGLSEHGDVELLEVTKTREVTTEHLDLLVVGGPTHGFSMTRPTTREEAVSRGASHGSTIFGLREWLDQLHKGRHSELVATFDTRVSKVRHLPGSAAKSAAKIVSGLGYSSAAQAESFYVEDVSGPLLEGELDRAHDWGEWLGKQFSLPGVDHAKPGR